MPDKPKNQEPRRTPRWLRKLGRSLSNNQLLAWVVAKLAVVYLKFVFKTNKWQVEPADAMDRVKPELPAIAAVWHGQHVLIPAIPLGLKGSVMISRSLDGEITAKVAEAFENKTIRASGGRDSRHALAKGALKGFLEMLRALREGENVMQTADIPKGTPRRAGPGIIALAQKSGRPIIPFAVASSRRWVLPKSWDMTTINGPFGKSAIVIGEPVRVGAESDENSLEESRLQLQRELDRVTKRAYALTGNPE